MEHKKYLKRDTKLIILSVLVLTILTLNVSYSAFFSVSTPNTVQTISAGNLSVIIDGSTAMSSEDMFPTSPEDLPSPTKLAVDGTYATLNLTNSGTLDADFSVTITYDSLPEGKTSEDLLSFNYLIVGIYDVTNTSWVNFGTSESPVYYTNITALTPSDTDTYPILRSTIPALINNTHQYRVYVWLSEETPSDEIGKLVYLKLNVKSATVNGRIEE